MVLLLLALREFAGAAADAIICKRQATGGIVNPRGLCASLRRHVGWTTKKSLKHCTSNVQHKDAECRQGRTSMTQQTRPVRSNSSLCWRKTTERSPALSKF